MEGGRFLHRPPSARNRTSARDLGLDPADATHIDVATVEMWSSARCGGRVRLASLEPSPDLPPAVALLREACRASLDETPSRPELHALLRTYDGDPLWSALARHLARISDESVFLTRAALAHDKYPEPLSWGLQYMVKGDILLQDLTTHLHLDDLAREAGLDPLPIVDPMEPELRMDWEK